MAEQVICDKCGRVIEKNKISRTTLLDQSDNKVRWDLCGACMASFKRWLTTGPRNR